MMPHSRWDGPRHGNQTRSRSIGLRLCLLLCLVCAIVLPCYPGDATSAILPSIGMGQGIDVYSAKGAEAWPVLTYIPSAGHGRLRGNWLASLFVPQGIVFATFDYAVDPGRVPLGSMEDVARAVAWIHDHAKAFGGDPQRIIIMGFSAGAHMAALLSTDERYLQQQGKSLSILSGAVILDNDVFSPVDSSARAGQFDPWGGVAADASTAWEAVTPGSYVEPGKGIPPMLIVCSGTLTGRRGQDVFGFMELLATAGVEAQLVHAPEKSHESIFSNLDAPGDSVCEAILRFALEDRSQF
ncbi:alpha/beta hydrolase [Candidatus Bipolaricaulota bacterium]